MAFTQDSNNYNTMQAQPDRPTITATELKTEFDKNGNTQKTFMNSTHIAELESTTAGTSGADNIGYGGDAPYSTVADAINAIYSAGSGTIPPDGTITNAKLATDVKVGSLATLTTEEKGSVVGAINELDVMTTEGDIIYEGASGTPERLGIGTAGQVLQVNTGATAPEWGSVSTQVASIPLTGTSVTVSGLDIISDGGKYDIYLTGVTTSVVAGLLMYINGDTTATNYYNGNINATGTTNNATVSFATGYTGALGSNIRILLGLSASLYASATSLGESRYTSGVGGSANHWIHANTQTNITSLNFQLAGGASFTAGTIEIYKRS